MYIEQTILLTFPSHISKGVCSICCPSFTFSESVPLVGLKLSLPAPHKGEKRSKKGRPL